MDLLKLNLGNPKISSPTEGELRWQAGLLSAIAAVALNLIVRFAFGAPLVPELLADFIFAITPISLVEFAVTLLGTFAKHFAFIGCVVLYIAALAALATGFLRARISRHPVSVAALVLFIWGVSLFVIFPALGGGVLGRHLRQGGPTSSIWQLVVCAVYGLSLEFFQRIFFRQSEQKSWIGRMGVRWLSRRQVLAGIGYAVVGAGIYDVVARPLWLSLRQSVAGRVRGGNGIFPNIDGLAREVTPTGDFYQVSKNPFDPDVDLRKWKCEVAGLVENPFALTFEEIKKLPTIEQYATLECISNTVGGKLIDNALWRGVALRAVLERVRLKAGVVDVVLSATDGYADSIPLSRAMAEGTILAYEMNGAPLNTTHGFPLRLIVPGIYGMKNVKWITRIEMVDYDFKGYWQARGWDDVAKYKIMSRIDVPRKTVQGSVTIAGIAFAGDRGISKVEISTNDGKTWEPAEIKPPLSLFAWVLWHKDWSPTRPGNYSLVVRATDGQGLLQTADEEPPIPDGASGYHRVIIKAE